MAASNKMVHSTTKPTDLASQFVRGLSVVGCLVGGLGLLFNIWNASRGGYNNVRMDRIAAINFIVSFAANAALLIGSLGLRRQRSWARHSLIIWGCTLMSWSFFVYGTELIRFQHILQFANDQIGYEIAGIAPANAFPFFVVFTLLHREVAKIFGIHEQRGFEVLPTAQAPSLSKSNSTYENNLEA